MSQFSSNETASLEKQIENGVSRITKTKPEDLNRVYEIETCLGWIKGSNYKKVCLQFPDHLLPDSTQIALVLESLLQQTVYVMADTAYESCCVDYVAAAHVNADAIIHFGQTCFSKQAEKVPCLRIYEKSEVNTEKLIEVLCTKFASDEVDQVLIVLDGPYLWKKRALEAVYKVRGIDEDDLGFGEEFKTVFITDNLIKAMNFEFRISSKELFVCNPQQTPLKIVDYNQDAKILKRRYFLAEKIKDSLNVGIIIGTLAVSNYLGALERVKTLLKLHKKKYYIISVGKPTVAKLANFPEIDLYVLISCAMNEIYESRDFYKPIVTPYDVESALNPQVKDLKFSYDYNTILNQSQLDPDLESKLPANDVSLLTGHIRSRLDSKPEDGCKELAAKADGTLALNNSHGAGFLASKSWKGLEQNLGENEPEIAEEGRRGIASGYQNEKT